jgi:hypothetical protein
MVRGAENVTGLSRVPKTRVPVHSTGMTNFQLSIFIVGISNFENWNLIIENSTAVQWCGRRAFHGR